MGSQAFNLKKLIWILLFTMVNDVILRQQMSTLRPSLKIYTIVIKQKLYIGRYIYTYMYTNDSKNVLMTVDKFTSDNWQIKI